ncbi:MAG: nuclear transport factor 2 family protein [Candidatus Udaeobacter sp.]
MNIDVPPTIATFFQAFNAHDADALTALFTGDALVTDEGCEYRGTDAIKAWIQKANASYKPRAVPTDLAHSDGKIVVTTQVSGTFPGSPAPLHYHFTLSDDKIAALTCD